MDLREITDCARRHPWETARAGALASLARRHWPRDQARRVLDVGCGDGFAGRAIIRGWPMEVAHGVDTNLSPEDLGRFSDTNFTCFQTFADLRSDYTDLLLLDVLEHIPDDAEFLKTLSAQRLIAGGLAFITVPAFPSLWSDHDEFLRHCRRYRRRELLRLVEDAGLEMLAEGYWFLSLLLVRSMTRMIEKATPFRPCRRQGIGSWERGAFATRVVDLFLKTDTRVLTWLRRRVIILPGLSLWAVARKR